jgi:hypothetical protein
MRPTKVTFRLLLTVGLTLLLTATASACPFCEGGPSGRNEVNEAIFGDGFWFNVVAVALPFVFVGALAVAVHGVPVGRNSARAEGPVKGAVDGRTY